MKSDESISGQRVAKETPPSPPKPRKQSGDRDNYNDAIIDAFYQPVITVRALAETLAPSMGGEPSDETVAQIEQGLMGQYPSGMVSMAQANNEMYIVGEWARAAGAGELRTPEAKAAFRATMDAIRGSQTLPDHELNTMRALTGIEQAPQEDAQRAAQLYELVSEHGRGGRYAKYGGRTQEEDDRLHQAYGDDAYHRVTPEMQQNLDAQRVADLISAQTANYQPNQYMPQVQRFLGGSIGPVVNLAREFTTEPGVFTSSMGNLGQTAEDMVNFTFNPDARYGYASRMYNQGREEQGTPNENNVYTQDGNPKYLFADPATPTGMANMMTENTSYPMARGYNSQFGTAASETPSRYWRWLNTGEPMYGDLREAQNELRQTGMQTNPVIPNGVNAEDAQRLQGQIKDSDSRMAGWFGAYWGPALSDYTNFVNRLQGRSGQVPRTLPSPAVESLVQVPNEIVRDPTNWISNGAFGAARVAGSYAKGGLKAGAKSLLKEAAMQPLQMGDDITQEMQEDGVIASAIFGPMDYLKPMDHNKTPNLLMGSQDPASKTYDADRAAAVDAATTQRDSAGKQLRRLQSARENQPRYPRMER